MIVILGAGVAGLAAARVLADCRAPFLLLEKERVPGGLCRSVEANGYTFDMSGHFMHSGDRAMKEWILGLPGIPWATIARDARVFLRGKLTPYPFQANLHGHDPGFVRRCLADFAGERIRDAVSPRGAPADFSEWLLRRFGREMCRAFFFPYNRKMWRTPLERMGYSWTGWSVPVPGFEDVLAGARGERRDGLGYNPVFHYPRAGGMGRFVRVLAGPVLARIRRGEAAARIHLARRVVTTARGEEIPYRAVISTIPLPELAAGASGLSARARKAATELDWVKLLAVNLGIRRPGRFPGHWHYVPGREYPFFRVGALSNVSPAAAPPGCASIFADRSFPARARIDVRREIAAVVEGLRKMGVVTGRSVVDEIRPFVLDPAYVVFNRARDGAVSLLRTQFERRGVYPAGRYGAWDYFGIEASVADGIRAAREAVRFAAR